MGRAPCCDKANVKKGPWSPEEDSKLKEYIEKCGTGGNWIALPQKAGLKRCGKSCRLRWLNYLRPNIKHGDFSDDEDRIICNLFANIGSRWSIIAAQLPGRTDNDIKNYWNTKLKKKLMAMVPHSQRKLPPPFPHHTSSLGASHSLSSIYKDLTGTNFLSCYTKALTGIDPISQISSSLLGGNNCTTAASNLLSAASSTSSMLYQAQEGLVGSIQYYNYSTTPQVIKDNNNILVFGSEASCSSNSDGSCSQISYGKGSDHHIKQEDHHQMGFQGYNISSSSGFNEVNNNHKFFLSYGSSNNENNLSQWGSAEKPSSCYNFGSETQLEYDLEDVKQLMSSNNNNCSHISSFLVDENKTVAQDNSSMYY